MTRHKRYDILLVNFPFSDLTQTKKRPALVVADIPGDNTILCQITTSPRSNPDYQVPLQQADTGGDIRFDSYISTDVIFTLDKSLIEHPIGAVEAGNVKTAVREKLTELFS